MPIKTETDKKNNKTKPWTMEELDEAVKDLDKDESRDTLGHINELYRKGVAGTDLKLATLKLINLLKENQKYPKLLNHVI